MCYCSDSRTDNIKRRLANHGSSRKQRLADGVGAGATEIRWRPLR